MAKSEPKKRELKFNSLDEMIAEVHALSDNGYTSHGNWTLGQTCGHLANWARFPLDGFPKQGPILGAMFWVMKHTIAPSMSRKILANGFKGGMPTDPKTVPKADQVSDEEGVEQLEQIVNRVKTHTGEFHPSPLFGPMDKEIHTKVTLLHAEHHLGYLEPKA